MSLKEIYNEAYAPGLCHPYATVIDINVDELPATQVRRWSSEEFASTLWHDPSSNSHNRSLRHLLHASFTIAARMERRYLYLLQANEEVIAKNVTPNLSARHIRPVFLGTALEQKPGS